MDKEIGFAESPLFICVHYLNRKDNYDKLKRYLEQSEKAAEEHPESVFWKDAVNYLKLKLGVDKRK